MNDDQLLRYSRHILLPEVGIEGQERLLAARVLVVGVGGLGSPAATYLAAAGVGTLLIADGDDVDLSNLQRQTLHADGTIGMPKVDSAEIALKRVNPSVDIIRIRGRLEGTQLREAVRDADVVLDCTDNFATRHEINGACVASAKPLVSGAAIRFDGQISVFDTRDPGSPCYACLYPRHVTPEEVRCAVLGVFAPLTGIIGTMQAAEALKLLIAIGEPLRSRLLLFDALQCDWRSVRLKRDPDCSVCAKR